MRLGWRQPWFIAVAGGARRVRRVIGCGLPPARLPLTLGVMFSITEAQAEAIRTTFERDGELSAAIEVRRLFPGITTNQEARSCARSIAGWTVPAAPQAGGKTVVTLRPRRR